MDRSCAAQHGKRSIHSIAVSGDDVYASGIQTDVLSTPLYWKNNTCTWLKPLDVTKNSYVACVAVSGKDVYVGGYSTNSSNVRVGGCWKNGKWNGFEDSTSVYSLAVSGSDVYAGGVSNNSSGVSVAGYWKNSAWTAFTSLDPAQYSVVYSIVVK